MGAVTLYDTEPEFAVARDESGDVALTIRAENTTITVSVGRVYDSASLLAQSLHRLAEDLDDEILDEWEDPLRSSTPTSPSTVAATTSAWKAPGSGTIPARTWPRSNWPARW
jgi:hypothetical protein